MGVDLRSPYGDQQGRWIRGSFHGHCTENSACSSVPLSESVRRYCDLGVGFVTLTDHDVVTDLAEVGIECGQVILVVGLTGSTDDEVHTEVGGDIELAEGDGEHVGVA